MIDCSVLRLGLDGELKKKLLLVKDSSAVVNQSAKKLTNFEHGKSILDMLNTVKRKTHWSKLVSPTV